MAEINCETWISRKERLTLRVDPATNNASGEVITFYSYKGGTGRTMALSNVGCTLAKRMAKGAEVLMIDWDLEAPGD